MKKIISWMLLLLLLVVSLEGGVGDVGDIDNVLDPPIELRNELSYF